MNLKIRLANLTDAQDMANIHARSWEVAYKDIIPMDYIKKQSEKRKALWEKILSGANEKQYIIELDGKPVGMMCVAPPQIEEIEIKNDTGIDDSFWELHGIYLLPDYYRKGIGAIVMKYAFDKAITNGAENMILWVFEDNVNSIKFYEKCGFVADGASKIYYCGKEMNCIRMRKYLL